MTLPRGIVRSVLTSILISLLSISGWGWDAFKGFFAERARVLFLIVWLILSFYGACRNTHTSASGGKTEIRRHRQILWLIVPLWVVWFLYLPYADRHNIGIVPHPMVRWGGVLIFAASLILRIEAIRAQGKQFSMAVAIQEDHKLATTGPYRLVRHPAYAGVIGMMLGISLIFANPVIGFMMTVVNGFWLGARIRDEEKLLIEEFGNEYGRYLSKTRKIIPFIY